MPWFQIHQILHPAMYWLGGAAVLSFIVSLLPRASAHFRFFALALMPLIALAWLGDDFVVSRHSPTEVLTGQVVTREYHSRKSRAWYTFVLRVDGRSISGLGWETTKQGPPVGQTVALTVYQWNRGDTTEIRILTGKAAGFTWEATNSAGFDLTMMIPSALFLVFCLGWWIVYGITGRAG